MYFKIIFKAAFTTNLSCVTSNDGKENEKSSFLDQVKIVHILNCIFYSNEPVASRFVLLYYSSLQN